MTTLQRRWALVVFVLCFLVTLLRGWQRVLYPHLWAEDGSIFFYEHLTLGDAAIMKPYAGYFHLLPRLLSAVYIRLPLAFFPFLVTLSCYALWAVVAAQMASERLAYLLPSLHSRLLAAVLTCFAPALVEVGGNLANLHHVLFVSLALIALSDSKRSLSGWELGWTFVCGATEGAAFTLIPAFIARAYSRSRKLTFEREHVASAIILCTTLGILFIGTASDSSGASKLTGATLFASIYRLILDRFFLTPWLGSHWPTFVAANSLFLTTLAALPFVGLAVASLKGRLKRHHLPLLCVMLALVALYATTWVVRPASFVVMQPGAFRHSSPMHRYWFITWPFGIIFTLFVLSRFRHQWSYVLAGVCIAAQAHFFFIPRLQEAPPWAEFAPRLESVRREGGSVEVPLNPAGWAFTYRVDASVQPHAQPQDAP